MTIQSALLWGGILLWFGVVAFLLYRIITFKKRNTTAPEPEWHDGILKQMDDAAVPYKTIDAPGIDKLRQGFERGDLFADGRVFYDEAGDVDPAAVKSIQEHMKNLKGGSPMIINTQDGSIDTMEMKPMDIQLEDPVTLDQLRDTFIRHHEGHLDLSEIRDLMLAQTLDAFRLTRSTIEERMRIEHSESQPKIKTYGDIAKPLVDSLIGEGGYDKIQENSKKRHVSIIEAMKPYSDKARDEAEKFIRHPVVKNVLNDMARQSILFNHAVYDAQDVKERIDKYDAKYDVNRIYLSGCCNTKLIPVEKGANRCPKCNTFCKAI